MYKLLYIKTASTCANMFYLSDLYACGTNSLPAESKHFSSLLQFKAFINGTDLNQFVLIGF